MGGGGQGGCERKVIVKMKKKSESGGKEVRVDVNTKN